MQIRHRLARMSLQTRLTLTIAGAFIGVAAVFLVAGLIIARTYDLGIVSYSIAVGTDATILVSGETSTTRDVSGVVVDTSRQHLPALLGWAVAILTAFAIIATSTAWWISHRSLGRLTHISALLRGLSAQQLSGRLAIDGPDDDIGQLSRVVNDTLDRLERGVAEQQRFIANASHELRTPLAGTRLALEIPLVQQRVPPDLQGSFADALAATARSESIISDLLLLAQCEHQSLLRAPINFSELVTDQVARHQDQARAGSIQMLAEIEPGVAVMGSASLLEHLVRNLLDNAIRHNLEGGTVWIALAGQHHRARLTVENTGAQITPDDAPRLLEPFNRGDSSRLANEAGIGLGLAIVRQIVTAHDATLTIASRPAGGLVLGVTMERTPEAKHPATVA